MTEEKKFTYAILQETNCAENESWYYFLRYQGNEVAIENLQKELYKIDFQVSEGDDYSIFELETNYLVSEQTAKEMIHVDLNSFSFHRKFDGKMNPKISFGIKPKDKQEKKMEKITMVLGYGGIEKFIDGEDFDGTDHANYNGQSESSEESSDDSEDTESSDESSNDTGNSSDESENTNSSEESDTEKNIPDVPDIREQNETINLPMKSSQQSLTVIKEN